MCQKWQKIASFRSERRPIVPVPRAWERVADPSVQPLARRGTVPDARSMPHEASARQTGHAQIPSSHGLDLDRWRPLRSRPIGHPRTRTVRGILSEPYEADRTAATCQLHPKRPHSLPGAARAGSGTRSGTPVRGPQSRSLTSPPPRLPRPSGFSGKRVPSGSPATRSFPPRLKPSVAIRK